MKEQLGGVIATRRKQMGWTQKQLAETLGVSDAAVSKWETGATCPDITLLPPLARTLGTTVDQLLSFSPSLTEPEIAELARQTADIFEREGFDAGNSFQRKLLQQYPNSNGLKMAIASLVPVYLLMKPDFGKEQIHRTYQYLSGLMEQVLHSNEQNFTHRATTTLVGYCTMLGDIDRAQQLLDSLPKLSVLPQQLYPSIYLLQGNTEKACKTVQANISQALSTLSQNLILLHALTREEGAYAKAEEIATANLRLLELFGRHNASVYPGKILSLMDKKRTTEAAALFSEYVNCLSHIQENHRQSPFFDRMEPQENNNPDYMAKLLAKGILISISQYQALEEEPVFQDAVLQLRQLAEEKPQPLK